LLWKKGASIIRASSFLTFKSHNSNVGIDPIDETDNQPVGQGAVENGEGGVGEEEGEGGPGEGWGRYREERKGENQDGYLERRRLMNFVGRGKGRGHRDGDGRDDWGAGGWEGERDVRGDSVQVNRKGQISYRYCFLSHLHSGMYHSRKNI